MSGRGALALGNSRRRVLAGFALPKDLAVDPSAGPTAGDVYVVDKAHGRVLRFDSGGHRDTVWADEGELRLSGAAGVAVDANGRLHVLALGSSEDLVRTFDPNATEIGSVVVTAGEYPNDLEIDGVGDLYVPGAQNEIVELAADGSRLGGFTVGSGWETGFTVDAVSGNVFLSHGSAGIGSYSAGCYGDPCSATEIFGERYVGWASDLAIDEVDEALYAIGGSNVAVFLPATQIPEATTGRALLDGEHEADLEGMIDATGGPAVIGCRFEYVTQAGFEADGFAGADSAPCRQSTPISTQQEVDARVSGLDQGTYYRFRLAVETADKTVYGLDERLKTPILPAAQTGPARTVGPESALLSGTVESPAARPILKCEFELESHDVLNRETHFFLCDQMPFYEADERVEVTGQATFLRPGTEYSYWISVVNVDGRVDGLPQTFTTAAATPREPKEEIESPRHPRHHPNRKIPCARRACTELLHGSPHSRVWVSPRFPRTYGWLLELLVDGNPLHHTALEEGCRSTFAGHGTIARLNGCHGRIRLVYRGSGLVRVRWRVYAHCRCAEVARASADSAGVSGA